MQTWTGLFKIVFADADNVSQVREGLEVRLSALGIDAPCIAMRAVCHARGYLKVSRLPPAQYLLGTLVAMLMGEIQYVHLQSMHCKSASFLKRQSVAFRSIESGRSLSMAPSA